MCTVFLYMNYVVFLAASGCRTRRVWPHCWPLRAAAACARCAPKRAVRTGGGSCRCRAACASWTPPSARCSWRTASASAAARSSASTRASCSSPECASLSLHHLRSLTYPNTHTRVSSGASALVKFAEQNSFNAILPLYFVFLSAARDRQTQSCTVLV